MSMFPSSESFGLQSLSNTFLPELDEALVSITHCKRQDLHSRLEFECNLAPILLYKEFRMRRKHGSLFDFVHASINATRSRKSTCSNRFCVFEEIPISRPQRNSACSHVVIISQLRSL